MGMFEKIEGSRRVNAICYPIDAISREKLYSHMNLIQNEGKSILTLSCVVILPKGSNGIRWLRCGIVTYPLNKVIRFLTTGA